MPAVILSAAAMHATAAAEFPVRPVRILTAEAGGGLDLASRIVSQGVSAALGQQVIVENRGGGGGVIAIDTAAKAQPDGYTLLVFGSALWLMPYLRKNLPYDPVRDFAPVTLVATAPNIMVVHPSSAANSVGEFIALAKSKSGELNFGAGGLGSSSHLATELFQSLTGVKLVHVPYKGSGQALTALMAGQLQIMFATAGTALTHVRSRRLKALAVTTPQPSALLPGVPTVAASGVPGYESVAITGMFAPVKTPAALVRRLNEVVARFLQTPEAKERFLTAGADTVGGSPEELAAMVKSEMSRMGKVIRDAGIRED